MKLTVLVNLEINLINVKSMYINKYKIKTKSTYYYPALHIKLDIYMYQSTNIQKIN